MFTVSFSTFLKTATHHFSFDGRPLYLAIIVQIGENSLYMRRKATKETVRSSFLKASSFFCKLVLLCSRIASVVPL